MCVKTAGSDQTHREVTEFGIPVPYRARKPAFMALVAHNSTTRLPTDSRLGQKARGSLTRAVGLT